MTDPPVCQTLQSGKSSQIPSFFKRLFIFERKRERERGGGERGGVEGQRERERIPSRLYAVSVEHGERLNLMNLTS